MKLNPPKCKQMVINFMHNHNFSLNPIWLGNDVIETVRVYKLLGIILSHDLRIIFPHLTYEQALTEAGIETLAERRYALCLSYILKLKDRNHPLHFLLPKSVSVNRPYNLRSATASSLILFRNKSFCKTQRSSNFITFKYL